jgi:pantoate--beta-alanine ligase
LHPGHLSLIQTSNQQCDVTICSIFVNPTQFNDKNDLQNYPRKNEADIALLKEVGCNVLFLPTEAEIYPEVSVETFNFGNLDKVLEGKYRPGHFNGVAMVVKRLFEIIKPNKAFFGSKDFQQVLVVKKLNELLGLDITIVACPTVREPNGLAMSSRNMLLSAAEAEAAQMIPGMMQQAWAILTEKGISEAKQFVNKTVAEYPIMKLDYYEVCHAETLEVLQEAGKNIPVITLIGIFSGKIRLIDNYREE